jgi:hypothetical protein
VVSITNWVWDNLGTIALIESLTEDGVIIVDVRDLSDIETNVAKVKKKIIIVSSLMGLGCRVAVRCVGGINRSNTIALAVMCYMNPQGDIDTTWDFHYNYLKVKVPRAHLVPNLTRTCKKALKELMKDFEGVNF